MIAIKITIPITPTHKPALNIPAIAWQLLNKNDVEIKRHVRKFNFVLSIIIFLVR